MKIKMVEFKDYRGEGVFPRSSRRFCEATGYTVELDTTARAFRITCIATGAVLYVDAFGAEWEADAPAAVDAAPAAQRRGRNATNES